MLCYDKAFTTYPHTCSKRPLLLAHLTATKQENAECHQRTQTGTATTNEWLMEHEEKSLLSDVCTSSTRAMQLAELSLILQVLKRPIQSITTITANGANEGCRGDNSAPIHAIQLNLRSCYGLAPYLPTPFY
ncbi:uncharacterized [Tachysurus ichikawai]